MCVSEIVILLYISMHVMFKSESTELLPRVGNSYIVVEISTDITLEY
jgi:hypothetical protein